MEIITPGGNKSSEHELHLNGDVRAKYLVRDADSYLVKLGRLKFHYTGKFEYDGDGNITSAQVSEFEVLLNGKSYGRATGLNEPIQQAEFTQVFVVSNEKGGQSVVVARQDLVRTPSTASDHGYSKILFGGGPEVTVDFDPDTGAIAVSSPDKDATIKTTTIVKLDEIFSPYFSGPDTIRGDSGDNNLMGFNGQDKLFGGRGDDSLEGGKGRDLLSGGNGHDVLKGGAGADDLRGGNGKDQLDGGNGADKLRGGKGGDDLDGGLGHDRLWGGRGRDDLDGGQHDDVIHGGKGRDSLTGGAGTDRLTGGGGRDTFVFNEGHGSDTVTDFLNGADLLDVSDFGFDSADGVLALASLDGTDTVIQLSASDKIILQDTDLADLNSLHFIV